jgi:hypothetical protein
VWRKSLVVCFRLHETLCLDAFDSPGYAVGVYGVRDDWAPTASVAGVAQATCGSAGGAQGRSRDSHMDGSQHYDRSAESAELGSDADLPGTGTRVDAL